MRPIIAFVCFLAAPALGLFTRPCPAAAETPSLRIDNAVYVGREQEPSSRSTTIFQFSLVCDFMEQPPETIVFDVAAKKFTLLNLQNRTRAELTCEQLSILTDRLQQSAVEKSKDPVIKFLAAPKFDERFDEQSGELTLSSPLVEYRVKLLPETDAAVLEHYRLFADWYAKLNALLTPVYRPPFGRLAVNSALAERRSLAGSVELKIASGKDAQQGFSVMRSEHRISRQLTADDAQRVAQTKQQLQQIKLVDFRQYRKTDKQ